MEKALQDTIIAKDYGLSLKSFFKDRYKYSNDCYLIPIDHIHHFKRYIYDFITSSCNDDIVCSKLQSCHGHQFLQFIELIINFERYSVMRSKIYFGYFLFSNFKLTSDTKITLKPTKIKSWTVTGVFEEKLYHLGYKKRLSFLKWKTLTLKNYKF